MKLYIYGYLNRIRSSRRLEAETHRNIELIWLMRMLKPDFKTIADFRCENAKVFKKVFREFVVLCRQLDLFGRELLAVDGTKIKAVNNKNRNYTKATLKTFIEQCDNRLEKYLAKLERVDQDEQGMAGGGHTDKLKEKIEAIKTRRNKLLGYQQKLAETGKDQISLTDPDSRAQSRAAKVGVGYTVQTAVDAKHKLIAGQEVHIGATDMGYLTETAKAAKGNIAAGLIDVVADKGYFQAEDIEACEKAGMTPYVPKPERGPARREGLFPKEDFTFDAERDVYVCPGGRTLEFRGMGQVRENLQRRIYSGHKVCAGCPLKAQCTKGAYRTLTRFENEEVLERMAERIKARPEMQNARRETVEHPFGSIKQWMNQGAFLMRGLDNVRGEFSLTALAYNLRRTLNIVDFRELMAAVKA